jgi:hypothetical protein
MGEIMSLEPDYPQYFCRIRDDYSDNLIWAYNMREGYWEGVEVAVFNGCEIPELMPVPEVAVSSGALWFDEQSLCVVATSKGLYVIDGYELEVER